MSEPTAGIENRPEQESPFSSREERLAIALKCMGELVDRRGVELLEFQAAVEKVRELAKAATPGGFGQLCCCADCEDAQENGRDAPHEPTWSAWTLNPADVLAALADLGGES